MPILLRSSALAAALLTCACGDGAAPLGSTTTGDHGDAGGADGAGGSSLEGKTVSFAVDETRVVVEGTGHFAFPDLVRLPDGRVLLVYRRGTDHYQGGAIWKVFSGPDAASWTSPELLFDDPALDDRDPSVAVMKDGRVLETHFKYLRTGTDRPNITHVFAALSSDGAATFDPFAMVDTGSMEAPALGYDAAGLWLDDDGNPVVVKACSSGAIEAGARWLLPTYGTYPLNKVDASRTPPSRVDIFVSDDGGAGWERMDVHPEEDTSTWLQEPALLRLDDGSFLLQVRTAEGEIPSDPGPLMQAESLDGEAWTSFHPMPFVGHAPELLQLRSGVVLSAFRHLDDALTREDVSIMASTDRGRTWGDLFAVRDCGAVECGYPAMVELDDGRLLVAYYAPGGTGIEMATFRVLLSP